MTPPFQDERLQRPLQRLIGRPFLAAALSLGLLTFLLVATNAWLAWRAHADAWSQAAKTSRNLGHSVAHQLDSVFSEVARVLNTIEYIIEQADMEPSALESLQPLMVNHLGNADYLHGIFVYDANGNWLVHTQATQPPNANNSDREYFISHRDSPSKKVLISKPLKSRSTGEWIIPVSKRLNDANGRFAGVVLATIRVGYLLTLLDGFDIGEQGAISLSLADGILVVRRPYSVEDLGRTIPNNPLLNIAKNERAGMLLLASPFDGIRRLVIFEHLGSNPLFVTVALSEEEILSHWRSATQVQAICLLLLITVIALSGSYVFRSMKVRREADRALHNAHEQIMRKNQQLAELADQDGLTGIFNRRAFDIRLAEIFGQSRRYQRKLSTIIFDVDHFKNYNDIYGHLAGDDCLRQVASALSGAMRRPGDILARYGGEEFFAILPDTDGQGALEVANSARERIESLMLVHAGSDIGIVTVSCGVATADWNDTNLTSEKLIDLSDQALYAAKRLGRNRCILRASGRAKGEQ